jgi:sugar lactone lactonase YvrE
MAPLLSAANVIILTILLVAKSFSAGAAVSDATDAKVPVVYSFSERALIEASFTTIAGTDSSSGGYNGDSIPANTAYLFSPTEIEFDALGNLHFNDYGNSRIRKVDKDTGIITTVAGTGQQDFNGDGILAVNANLYPMAFTFDVYGDLFISDFLNSRIRKVALATGIITTVAGNGLFFGYNGDNILATTASIALPRAITSDAQGNLYFVDYYNYRVRKVTRSTGLITTVAGNGEIPSSTPIPINVLATSINMALSHLVIDTSGDLYGVDFANNHMVKISSSTGMVVKSRTINNVGAIYLDAAGTLYYTDSAANKIYKELASGEIVTVATDVYSYGFNVDTTGSIYVSLYQTHTIVKVDLNGNVAAFPTSRPTSMPTMEVTAPSMAPLTDPPSPPTVAPSNATAPPTSPSPPMTNQPITRPITPPPATTPLTVTAPPTSPTPPMTNPPLTRPTNPTPTPEPTRRPTTKRPNRRRPSKAPMCKPPRRS